MCGICGVFRPDRAPIDPASVIAMRDSMPWRGPDSAGLMDGPGYSLGHRRLSIIDLSDAGLQPMTNAERTLLVVLNGEIYNFAALRDELEASGYKFRSKSDTEVILHGYQHWGIKKLLTRLRGMFAFALIDLRTYVIHLARDPLGKKPLFYHWDGKQLSFASAVGALIKALDATPEVVPAAVQDLIWNLYIPGSQEFLQGVRKLAPGTTLSIDANGSVQDFVHWKPDFTQADLGRSREEWLEQIEKDLEEAIRRRLVADVPVGVLLSGGVDSSLVAAIAARCSSGIRTFSLKVPDPALDESRFAAAVARHCATDHTELVITGENTREKLLRITRAMGEPLADASVINTFVVAEAAKAHVTVVLTGDGGDEGFGGYRSNLAYYVADRVNCMTPPGLNGCVSAMARMCDRGSGRIHALGTVLNLATKPFDETYETGWVTRQTLDRLFTPDFRDAVNGRSPGWHYREKTPSAGGLSERDLETRIQTILPDDYLMKVDSATMANSLEARSPFLDVDLLETATRIPAYERFRSGQPKSMLRELARRYVPRECVDRRKRGFVAPVGEWIRGDWADLARDLLLGPHVERRGWFRRQALESIFNEPTGTSGTYLLWTLMVLELWIRIHTE